MVGVVGVVGELIFMGGVDVLAALVDMVVEVLDEVVGVPSEVIGGEDEVLGERGLRGGRPWPVDSRLFIVKIT